MIRTIIMLLALTFSISLCMAQNIQKEKINQEQSIQEQKRIQDEQEKIKQDNIRRKAEEQRQRDLQQQREAEQRYQNAIASAQRNFDQRQYAQAKQDYLTAIELKPENAASFSSKMTELDRLILEKAIEDAALENERMYNESIASAQRNFSQRQYAQAKQDYLTALSLKPENADFINSKIAEMEKPAMLHIYRKGTLLSILSDNYDIFLDNMVVARTQNKWKTTVTVNDIGTKTISATNDGMHAEAHIVFEPGRNYYVRCNIITHTVKTGEWKTRKKKDGTSERYEETRYEHEPKLELVEAKLGEREFNAIKSK